MQRAQLKKNTTVNVFIVFFTRPLFGPLIGPGIALNSVLAVVVAGCAKYLLSDEYLMSSSSGAPLARQRDF